MDCVFRIVFGGAGGRLYDCGRVTFAVKATMSRDSKQPSGGRQQRQSSFTEPVTSATISSFRNVGNPAPYTLYTVQVSGSVRSWSLEKRFSDFDDFHHALSEAFPSPPNPPVPANLPPKKFFSRLSESVIQERRSKLEEYLNVLLQCPDPRWRRSTICREFLAVPSSQVRRVRSAGDNLNPKGSETLHEQRRRSSYVDNGELLDPETWVEECRDLQSTMTSIRQLVVRRENMITSMGGSSSGQVSQTLELQNTAKKMISDASRRISVLQKSLQTWDTHPAGGSPGSRSLRSAMSFDLPSARTTGLWPLFGKPPESHLPTGYAESTQGDFPEEDIHQGPVLSSREISRRQDLVDQLCRDHHHLLKEVNKGATELLRDRQNPADQGGGRRRIFGDFLRSTSSTPSMPSTSPSHRFFGTPDEPDPTVKQRSMDTTSVLKLQESMLSHQDNHLEEITAVLRRQKMIGTAIGEELDVQNRLLDSIDDQVDKVGRNLKSAEHKIGKLG